MRTSLYDILSGRFADGRYVSEVHEAYRVVPSIMSNLNRLFNTRRGSIAHLPDYGLPDISEIYQDIPDSIAKLQNAIVDAVQHYEPRLRRVRVLPQDTEPHAMRLEFLLSAELPDRRPVRFQTTFSSIDPAKVEPYARRD